MSRCMTSAFTTANSFPLLDPTSDELFRERANTNTASPKSLEISSTTDWHPELSFDLSFGSDHDLDLKLEDPLDGLKQHFQDGFEKRASAYLSRQAEQRSSHGDTTQMDWEPNNGRQYTLAVEVPLDDASRDNSNDDDPLNHNPTLSDSDCERDCASIYSSDWEQYEELPKFDFSTPDRSTNSPEYWQRHDSAVDVSSAPHSDTEYLNGFFSAPADAASTASNEWADKPVLDCHLSDIASYTEREEDEALINVIAPLGSVPIDFSEEPPEVPQSSYDHGVNHDLLTVPGESCVEVADRTVMEAALARFAQPTNPLNIKKRQEDHVKLYSWDEITTNINAITKSIEQWEQRLQHVQPLSESPPLQMQPFVSSSPEPDDTRIRIHHPQQSRKDPVVEPLEEEEAIDNTILHELGIRMDSKPPQVRDSIICGMKEYSLDEMDDCIGDDEQWWPVPVPLTAQRSVTRHLKSHSMSSAFAHRTTRHRVLGTKFTKTVKF